MNHCMVLALLMPNLRKGGNLYAAVTSELVPIDHRGFGTSVNFDYSVFFLVEILMQWVQLKKIIHKADMRHAVFLHRTQFLRTQNLSKRA